MSQSGIGSAEYRIPKVPVAVQVTFEGGRTFLGDLHVLPQTALHEGRERVWEVLERNDRFLPLTTPDRNVLIHKDRIVMVRVNSHADAGIEDPPPAEALDVAVTIELGGHVPGLAAVDGHLRFVMPRENLRLLDFLNRAGDFVPIVLEGGPALIAIRYVVGLTSR